MNEKEDVPKPVKTTVPEKVEETGYCVLCRAYYNSELVVNGIACPECKKKK